METNVLNYQKLFYKDEDSGQRTVLVHCLKFGDSGKGKIVDIVSENADIIFRGTGGPNAGHTSYFQGKKLVTHLVPSGIRYDKKGTVNIIGSGTAVYPLALLRELRYLSEQGLSYNNLGLAYNAHLTTAAEIVWDRVLEALAGKGKIGSTGKGIGPTYSDHIGRYGLIVNDLLNADALYSKLKRQLAYYERLLKNFDRELVKIIMSHEYLEDGEYYNDNNIFNLNSLCERYLGFGQSLRSYIYDTDAYVRGQVGRANIVGEGSQGDLLDIDYGTYPYVTSSSCTVPGLAKGAGLCLADIDYSYGIIKGIMTRVGCGPLPTEIGGERSNEWCNGGEATKELELEMYPNADINDSDEFIQGVALRREGDEYGGTTGRPRRVAWPDLPLLRYALNLPFNSRDIITAKLDVMNKLKKIKVCTEYRYVGKPYYFAGESLIPGQILRVANPRSEILKNCQPIYKEFPGWQCDLSACHDYDSLPRQLKNFLGYISQDTGARIGAISVGVDREEMMYF